MQPLFRQEPLRSRRKARLSSVEDTLCRQAASSPPRRGVLAIRPPVSSPPLPSASRPRAPPSRLLRRATGAPAGRRAPRLRQQARAARAACRTTNLRRDRRHRTAPTASCPSRNGGGGVVMAASLGVGYLSAWTEEGGQTPTSRLTSLTLWPGGCSWRKRHKYRAVWFGR